MAPRPGARARRHDDPRARRARRRAAVGAAGQRAERARSYDDVQWMGVLRSLSGLQMYQRAVRGPIDGRPWCASCSSTTASRAVRALLREIRRALARAARPERPVDEVDDVDAVLRELDRRRRRRRRARRGDGRCSSPSPSSTGGSATATCDAGLTIVATRRPMPRARSTRLRSITVLPSTHAAAAAERLSRSAAVAIAGARREADRRAATGPGTAHDLVPRRRSRRRSRPWRSIRSRWCSTAPTSTGSPPVSAERMRVVRGACSPTSTGPRRSCATASCPARRSARRRATASAPSARRRRRAGSPLRRRRRRRSADGTWRVVQDLTDAPTGIGYALLDRSAMLPVADEMLGPSDRRLASLTGFPAELRHALATNTSAPARASCCSPAASTTPATSSTRQLARLLGFTLVERPDLVVRQGRLWLRTLGGLDPIDVVYRRVEDDDDRPDRARRARRRRRPGLLSAVADGGVVLANAHGCGLSRMSRWRGTGRPRPLRSPARSPAPAAARRGRQHGDRAVPDVPCAASSVDAAVVLRLHAVAGPDGVTVVMPGGNGRVLEPGDDPARPTARLVKDVWVLGRRKPLAGGRHAPLPQVDLARSVPTRAADALFWMGRSAERAEAIARTLRVVAGPPTPGPDARRPSTRAGGRRSWLRRCARSPTSTCHDRIGRCGREAPCRPRRRSSPRHEAARPAAADVRRRGRTVGEFLPAAPPEC